jgi:hypothetical protein
MGLGRLDLGQGKRYGAVFVRSPRLHTLIRPRRRPLHPHGNVRTGDQESISLRIWLRTFRGGSHRRAFERALGLKPFVPAISLAA